MKYTLAVLLVLGTMVHAYERQCIIDTPYNTKPPFDGGEYTYYVKLRPDGQTLTPGNIQEATTETCYIRLNAQDKTELQAVMAAYPVDRQLRDIRGIDPLSLVGKVMQDLTAKWAYERGGALPTVQDVLNLTKAV